MLADPRLVSLNKLPVNRLGFRDQFGGNFSSPPVFFRLFFLRVRTGRLETTIKRSDGRRVENLGLGLHPIFKGLAFDLTALFVELLRPLANPPLDRADHQVLLLFPARYDVHCDSPEKRFSSTSYSHDIERLLTKDDIRLVQEITKVTTRHWPEGRGGGFTSGKFRGW